MGASPIHRLYWRLQAALELLALFRHHVPPAPGEEEALRHRLAHREEHFLWMVEHLIFAHGGSPYRPLFELAGYDLPKVKQLVAARGLDHALDQLRDEGVYLRVREFKAGAPAVRRGRALRFQESDFGNPRVTAMVSTRSSGSRSRGTQAQISAEDLRYDAHLWRWMLEGYGLAGRDVIVWSTPTLGLFLVTLLCVMGRPPVRWWSPVPQRRPMDAVLLIQAARLLTGLRVPHLETAPAGRIADAAREIARLNTPRGMIFLGFVNAALRLVLAAEEAEVALGDMAFLVGGEPITPVKRRQFQDRGFRVFPLFGHEIGTTGWSCPVGGEADDMHVLTDKVAVRQYVRPIDSDGATVPAYLFTTLLPHTRMVMLNVESGDYGGLEDRSCGCFLDRVGLRLHMHTVRSFEKLTVEGMTFIGPSLVRLLEETLPREFGGDSRHYQLVEAEDSLGLTRLFILASPRLGVIDEARLQATVLREIGGRHLAPGAGRLIQQVWAGGQTVRVLRRDPLPTGGGKILHLHRDRGALQPDADGSGEEVRR